MNGTRNNMDKSQNHYTKESQTQKRVGGMIILYDSMKL